MQPIDDAPVANDPPAPAPATVAVPAAPDPIAALLASADPSGALAAARTPQSDALVKLLARIVVSPSEHWDCLRAVQEMP